MLIQRLLRSRFRRTEHGLENLKKFSIRLPTSVDKRLERLAQRERKTPDDLIERLVRGAVAGEVEELPADPPRARTIRLSESAHDGLRRLAKRRRRTASDVIEALIREEMREEDANPIPADPGVEEAD
jgi:predicted transcriptional regulator